MKKLMKFMYLKLEIIEKKKKKEKMGKKNFKIELKTLNNSEGHVIYNY